VGEAGRGARAFMQRGARPNGIGVVAAREGLTSRARSNVTPRLASMAMDLIRERVDLHCLRSRARWTGCDVGEDRGSSRCAYRGRETLIAFVRLGGSCPIGACRALGVLA
jgi:hypothetical protein